jgi:hypothetical protein
MGMSIKHTDEPRDKLFFHDVYTAGGHGYIFPSGPGLPRVS